MISHISLLDIFDISHQPSSVWYLLLFLFVVSLDTADAMETNDCSAVKKFCISQSQHCVDSNPSHSWPPTSSPPFLLPPDIPPVILSFTGKLSKPNFALLLETAAFVKLLEKCFQGSRLGTAGDLFISPVTLDQKSSLLKLSSVGHYAVSCCLTNAEAFNKGVIKNVPTSYSEEDILSLLSSQGVCEVKRLRRTDDSGMAVPIPVLVLLFPSSFPLPDRVFMAARVFDVEAQQPRPLICHKCWRFGHSQGLCSFEGRCRKCSLPHDQSVACSSSSKCPTCGKEGHLAGVALCPQFAERKKIMVMARDQKKPYQEARRRFGASFSETLKRKTASPSTAPLFALSSTTPELPSATARANHDALSRDMKALKSQFASLQQELKDIRATPTKEVVELQSSVNDLQDVVTGLTNEFTNIVPMLKQLMALLPQAQPVGDPPASTPLPLSNKFSPLASLSNSSFRPPPSALSSSHE